MSDRTASTGPDENQIHRPDLEEHWTHLTNGVMDHTLVKTTAEGTAPLEPGSIKESIGHFLSNWKFEIFIVVLIVLDLIFTMVESGLDYNAFCVTPELVAIGRDRIRSLEMQHEVTLLGQNLGHSSSKSNESFFVDIGSWQNATLGGAVMLQVSKSQKSLTKVAYVIEDFTGGLNATKKKAQASGHLQGQHSQKREGRYGRVALNQQEPGDESAGHEVQEGSEESHLEGHQVTLLCEGPHGSNLHRLAHVCHVASLCILFLFMVELAAKAWVNPTHFFQSVPHLVDFTVVTISFLVDIIWPYFRPQQQGELQADVAKIPLLLIRLWRVLRIVHGSSEMVHSGLGYVQDLKDRIQEHEAEIEKLKNQLEAAKEGREGKA